MKKLVYILPILLVLTGCFNSQSDKIEESKKKLGVVETNTIENIKQELSGEADPEIAEIKKVYEMEHLGENKFIKLDSLDGVDFYNGQVELSGTTLVDVDKITVNFSNDSSDFPDDNYTLKSFNSWDKSFKYRAYETYQTLDFGVNTYMITAYSGEEISKTRLTITLDEAGQQEAQESAVSFEKTQLGWEDNAIALSLPQGWDFGDMVKLGEDAFTYSKIDGLEITQAGEDFKTSCENITDYLTETLENNWFYWNTCRDIIYKSWEENQTAISFYVVTLEDESYNYVKHYLDFKNGLYGTYKIKSGEWVETEDKNTALAELNTTLKAQNNDFETTQTVDTLFKEIVR